MPKANYAECCIYQIVCDDTLITDIYVGHTTNMVKRKAQHKKLSKDSTTKVYTQIRANGGWDNYSMVLIERYPCADRYEAERRERYWVQTLSSTLNTQMPTGYEGKLCVHNTIKGQCISCYIDGTEGCGQSICSHAKRKSTCSECNGTEMCIHAKRKRTCSLCYPATCPFCKKLYNNAYIKRHINICPEKESPEFDDKNQD